ncbi:cysteine desulfurase NifS [Candidatus Micrarchaeota archaeon]|nr:cysteine desulfurase NifS [Candidatus Micrarchaeota archaeon]
MRIYLDHAATTPVDPLVLKAMQPYFSKDFGNASSIHSFGREAKEALEQSREKIAKAIGATAEEIIFTSGGSESDNLALIGIAFKNQVRGNHIITSSIEHPAVLSTCEYLAREGFQVSYAPVDKEGIVKVEGIEKVLDGQTTVISVMHANNEIGTIQPIEEIAEIVKEKEVYFHSDAVQTLGKIPVDVNKFGVDLLSLSAHKIYGPKGVGALYVRKGTRIQPIIFGGGHEKGLRSGTENVAGIVGFAKAVELANERLEEEANKQRKLRDKLIRGILEINDSWLNGHATKRLPNNVNVGFKYIEGEGLVLYLDEKGISASTGSACSSHKLEPSHVLTAIGCKPEDAHGSLRLTLGRSNTEKDVDYVLEALPGIVKKLRKMSPLIK